MYLDNLRTQASVDQLSAAMREQAEKLLQTEGIKVNPFQGKHLGQARRLLLAGIKYRDAKNQDVPVWDLIDYLRLSRPVQDLNGRKNLVTLWSETLDPQKSPIIRLQSGLSEPLELTQRGGAVIGVMKQISAI